MNEPMPARRCDVVTSRPDLWGGVEATVNRVGDGYFDQCQRNGHRERLDDLNRFADLGIKALRHGILWEVAAAANFDLGFADAPMARLRQLNVEPIVGLVHHGSGPPRTNLLDENFATGLADHAGAVARRYPWVRDYTPVNEPLTTARFSGLYGHWYPHHRDEAAFAHALVNQCRAIVLAMRAVRLVNPDARLIQTEDMGRTYATPRLAYQADYENHRRWLTFDLLTGRVDATHVFYERLVELGIDPDDLLFFLDNPTPPDVVGLNYYVTSDRFLDDRWELYPPWCRGGNENQAYADAEAARARPEGITGHRALLDAAWARYGLPVAFTEVHLGCSREEQLRWLREAWDAVCSARADGVDAQAVTVWSLLGAYDWNTLVTSDSGHYEPGAYDLSGGRIRPTALCAMVRELARDGIYTHPLAHQPGWWRRSARLLPTIRKQTADDDAAPAQNERAHSAPLLIVGARGTLGHGFGVMCARRGIYTRCLSRAQLDIADDSAVRRLIEDEKPWAVINTAGYVRVNGAEAEPERCFRENVMGSVALADACHAHGISLLTFSSHLVFDGRQREPYAESDQPSPLNTYGRSKHEAEQMVLAACPAALIVRTSALFGPWDVSNFVHQVLASLRDRRRFVALEDVTVSPTYVPDLVNACLDLLIDGESGLWHVTNDGRVTWLQMAREAASVAGFDPLLVRGQLLAAAGLCAQRPSFTAMRTERGWLLPSFSDALARFFVDRAAA
jgi:dTDP-4-dehydrorhamnose reductase